MVWPRRVWVPAQDCPQACTADLAACSAYGCSLQCIGLRLGPAYATGLTAGCACPHSPQAPHHPVATTCMCVCMCMCMSMCPTCNPVWPVCDAAVGHRAMATGRELRRLKRAGVALSPQVATTRTPDQDAYGHPGYNGYRR